MNLNKITLSLGLALTGGLFLSHAAIAEETVTEKAAEKTADVAAKAKSAAVKGAHRVQEAACTEGNLKCAAKKAKHRVQEAAPDTK